MANNRFDGQDVILFNTFNSKFESEFIATFEQRVRERGAISFAHHFVKRGRMGQQLSTEDMLATYDATYGGVGEQHQ